MTGFQTNLKSIFFFPSGDVKIIVKKGTDSLLFFKANSFYHIDSRKYEPELQQPLGS